MDDLNPPPLSTKILCGEPPMTMLWRRLAAQEATVIEGMWGKIYLNAPGYKQIAIELFVLGPFDFLLPVSA
jgi:hypothetical protein